MKKYSSFDDRIKLIDDFFEKKRCSMQIPFSFNSEIENSMKNKFYRVSIVKKKKLLNNWKYSYLL